jgi:hypothetical protein
MVSTYTLFMFEHVSSIALAIMYMLERYISSEPWAGEITGRDQMIVLTLQIYM